MYLTVLGHYAVKDQASTIFFGSSQIGVTNFLDSNFIVVQILLRAGNVNPFHGNGSFLYPLNTLENKLLIL